MATKFAFELGDLIVSSGFSGDATAVYEVVEMRKGYSGIVYVLRNKGGKIVEVGESDIVAWHNMTMADFQSLFVA